MRIGSNNIFQNASFVNQGQRPFAGAHINGQQTTKVNRNDTFEKQSQPKSVLGELMERKQQILDQKYSLMGKTIEKGGSLQDIKSQMDAYDEQLKNIDEQIKSEMINQQDKEEKDDKAVSSQEPKTKEDADAAKLQSIVEGSANIEQAEIVHNTKVRMEREVTTLQSEMALDSGSILQSKTDRVSELTAKINSLQENEQGMISDTTDKLDENNAVISEDPSYEYDTDKNAE